LKRERHGLKPYSFAPFAFAALENGHLEVLRLLFDSGLDYNVDRYSGDDLRLIDVAVDNKQKEALRLLTEYGTDLEYAWWGPHPDEFGYDPSYGEDEELPILELATRAGRSDLVEVFIESGIPLNGQSAEFYLERVRKNEVLRLEFEARQQEREKNNLQDVSNKIEYFRLEIGSPPWSDVDANRIDENGDNLLFRLLQQQGGLNRNDKAFLRHIVPLTDLSVTNKEGKSAWQIAENRLQGRVTLYLLKQAEITISL
jgi:ankyrin repeat protein